MPFQELTGADAQPIRQAMGIDTPPSEHDHVRIIRKGQQLEISAAIHEPHRKTHLDITSAGITRSYTSEATLDIETSMMPAGASGAKTVITPYVSDYGAHGSDQGVEMNASEERKLARELLTVAQQVINAVNDHHMAVGPVEPAQRIPLVLSAPLFVS